MAVHAAVPVGVAVVVIALLFPAADCAENFDPQDHLVEKRDPYRNTLLVIYDDPEGGSFPKAFRAGRKAAESEKADKTHLYSRLAGAVRLLEEEERPSHLNLSVAILSSTNEWFDLAAKEWGFTKQHLPLALFLVGSEEKGQKYKKALKDELAVHPGEDSDAPSKRGAFALRQFARRSFLGSGDEWVRSEPVPLDPPDRGEIQQIVGENYEAEVMKTGRDVLVMFGAPWCGFSKKLQKHLQTVARRTGVDCADPTAFCIAQIDNSANDHPRSSGVPHLEFVPQLYLYRTASWGGKIPEKVEPISPSRDLHKDPELLLKWLVEQGVVQEGSVRKDEHDEN